MHLKQLVLIAFAFVVTNTWAQDFTWAKFGYALSARTNFYSNEPLVSTPTAACNTPALRPLSFCYDQALKRPWCVLGRGGADPCGNSDSTQNDLNSGYVDEVCTRWPLTPELVAAGARSAAGFIGFDVSLGRCSCFTNVSGVRTAARHLRPDYDTPYCYDNALTINASRDTYKPGEAEQPIEINMFLSRGNKRQPGVAVAFHVVPGNEPSGTLSANQGVTDVNGDLVVHYTFPQFTKKRTDRIVFTCDSCAEPNGPVKIDIKMSPTLLGFFNGVGNTEKQANAGLTALQGQTDALRGKASVKYDLFYNQTGSANGSSVLQDLAEVFDQRSNELDGVLANRWESFWDVVAGRHSNPRSLTGQLLSQLLDSRRALADALDATFNATLGQIAAGWARLLSNPPTAADLASQLTKLRGYADDDFTLLLVAHSQGNLFVNTAVDGVRSAKPGVQAHVVHVAPASPTLRGSYLLADIDLVINGLRLQGINSVPPVNIALLYSAGDASGHTLVGTYLDQVRPALERVKSMIETALRSF